ncbi:uncharacterized protein LY89DRAFT_734539 [Mollisia scopiformis]|uniref:Uncharacterized protein n=1 Tax=Mollisia scopiformis TaxID=149040 RepID=A0A194X8E4_MOLSC|nr:uncharacterized protein LY89DRAFT_734539 [Mollisia scopiformis]KUJ16443.1 hypothetical protein LY89DRAFT_734539 [Mollisia scopiformis]
MDTEQSKESGQEESNDLSNQLAESATSTEGRVSTYPSTGFSRKRAIAEDDGGISKKAKMVKENRDEETDSEAESVDSDLFELDKYEHAIDAYPSIEDIESASDEPWVRTERGSWRYIQHVHGLTNGDLTFENLLRVSKDRPGEAVLKVGDKLVMPGFSNGSYITKTVEIVGGWAQRPLPVPQN